MRNVSDKVVEKIKKRYFFIVVPRTLITSRFLSPTNALFY